MDQKQQQPTVPATSGRKTDHLQHRGKSQITFQC